MKKGTAMNSSKKPPHIITLLRAIMTLVTLFAAAWTAGITTPVLAEVSTAFHTPSGNIHCTYGESEGYKRVGCEVTNRASDTPVVPQPADCDLSWGDSFELPVAGKPHLYCHGDTLRDPNGFVLPYGTTHEFDFGSIACTSEKAGLTCRNTQGHGFFLSRAKQRLF
jgi:hypothetical protein